MPPALQPCPALSAPQLLPTKFRLKLACLAVLVLCTLSTVFAAIPPAAGSDALELTRPVRSWEFLPAVGQRAALFGNESGQLEAWVYPLKLFRDFHLTFHAGGEAIP